MICTLVMRRFKSKGGNFMVLEHLYMSKTSMDKAKVLAVFHAQVNNENGKIRRWP